MLIASELTKFNSNENLFFSSCARCCRRHTLQHMGEKMFYFDMFFFSSRRGVCVIVYICVPDRETMGNNVKWIYPKNFYFPL